ncbi:hypothetical protein QVD17_31629 [Tagetes erecta]|uniref:Uncharacterized protein n=1 Tax=Tagetes erecta TaxID=13708 RepID=A0AAD8K7C6_TARER|nr:hypothetical protein QVD17_31629 [Tagetes erecta]
MLHRLPEITISLVTVELVSGEGFDFGANNLLRVLILGQIVFVNTGNLKVTKSVTEVNMGLLLVKKI